MKSKVDNGRHCKCKSCKELFKSGNAIRDKNYTHTYWIGDRQVSEKEFKEHDFIGPLIRLDGVEN